MNFGRRLGVKRRVTAALVVELEVGLSALLYLDHVIVALKMHILVLHPTPEALHEYVV